MGGSPGTTSVKSTSRAESTVANPDRLTDLEAHDIIDLSAIDANSTASGNQAFVKVAALTGAAGQLLLSDNAGTDITTLAADVDGDGSPTCAS